jgi:hypothetical protein
MAAMDARTAKVEAAVEKMSTAISELTNLIISGQQRDKEGGSAASREQSKGVEGVEA